MRHFFTVGPAGPDGIRRRVPTSRGPQPHLLPPPMKPQLTAVRKALLLQVLTGPPRAVPVVLPQGSARQRDAPIRGGCSSPAAAPGDRQYPAGRRGTWLFDAPAPAGA